MGAYEIVDLNSITQHVKLIHTRQIIRKSETLKYFIFN